MAFFAVSIFFFVVSKIIKDRVKKTKRQHNIQQGKIEYSDLNKPAKPFFSKKYRITGKPDYVVKQNQYVLPVELKTGNHSKPRASHVLQLAAYCQLIEDNYHNFVPYGVLVYNNQDVFKIPFDPKLRFDLENTLTKMRNYAKAGNLTRSHDDINRCKSCSMRQHCTIKIR